MSKIRQFWVWLFSHPKTGRTPGSIIMWWELRRIPYNLIVGCIGLVSLILFFISILSANVLEPGEDAVEPLAIIFAPVVINICYTAGWLIESILWFTWPHKKRILGPLLFKAGLAFSLFMVTLPAVFWGGF